MDRRRRENRYGCRRWQLRGLVDGIAGMVGYGLYASALVGVGFLSYTFTNVAGQVVITGTKNIGTKVVNR